MLRRWRLPRQQRCTHSGRAKACARFSEWCASNSKSAPLCHSSSAPLRHSKIATFRHGEYRKIHCSSDRFVKQRHATARTRSPVLRQRHANSCGERAASRVNASHGGM
eukprot:4154912-Pleurochrysis_carterae.AAC.3